MTNSSRPTQKRWFPFFGIIGVIAFTGAAAFFRSDDTEPQDVLIHGLGLDHADETYTFSVDGTQAGIGPFLCVPKMQQGKRKIEIRSATETVSFTANIGDVGTRIVEPNNLRGYDFIELSNCSDQELVRKQTTFPNVSSTTSSPTNGSATPTVR